jgi:hypothetical protein
MVEIRAKAIVATDIKTTIAITLASKPAPSPVVS